MGSLNREGGLSKILAQREGASREEGLKEMAAKYNFYGISCSLLALWKHSDPFFRVLGLHSPFLSLGYGISRARPIFKT